ncbi:MAG TPA: protein kinase [Streptosporangiaceae bacterium]|nr:protein kinase [Streptosporangiaceae bacterium]
MSEDVPPAPEDKAPRPRPKSSRSRPRAARPRPEPAPASEPVTPAGLGVGPGTKIAGYLLEEQIGQGGMAIVYRARDERLDRRVALKLLAPSIAADTAFRQRFIRESRAAAAVDHPNIIPVYDAGDSGQALFIAMRYVQGGDVRSLLARGGALSAPRAWRIISQVASALDAAHAHGLIHRDVKPANILLDVAAGTTGGRPDDDLPEHVYLSDFGISKLAVSSQLTSTGQFVGTLDYIAPEQIESHTVDGRTDQYSLACAAFELLSGEPPFRRDQAFGLIAAHLSESPPSLTARRPDLPTAVDLVLARAMAKSPAERYATCAQFATDLGRALKLVPGDIQALTPTVAAGGAPGDADKPKPWPATELAGRGSAPDAGSSGPGEPAGTPAEGGQAAVPAAAAVAGPAVQAQNVDPATMYAAQPGMPSGTNPPGAAGPYPQVAPGQQQYGPGQPGVQQGQPTGPVQYPPGPYGPAQYAQPSGPGQYPPGQYPPGQYPPGQYPPGQPGQGQYGPPQYAPPTGPVQYGQGPYGPGQYTQPQPAPPKRSRTGLLAGVAIAAVAIVAAGAFAVVHLKSPTVTSPSASGTPSATSPSPVPTTPAPTTPAPTGSTALSEATAVNSLLLHSASSLARLRNAIKYADNCTNFSYAIGQIQQATAGRQRELSQASGLSTGLLQNGAALMSDLTQALQYSVNADNAYLSWAQQQEASCQPGSSVGVDPTDNNGATTYKSMFVGLWDPIASQYGLTPFAEGQI